jgi:crotonobetainyl-CoA:carnitine CoA-transferase CaiB-like acyl-CoA transferase
MVLRVRDATGAGQQVQVNLLSSLLAALVNQSAATLATGNSLAWRGNAHPSVAPYETFRTGVGTLAVVVGNDRQFAALASVLGLRGLSEFWAWPSKPGSAPTNAGWRPARSFAQFLRRLSRRHC